MSVTYQKMRSGEWGIRSTEPLTPGQSVTVRKKSGETKTEIVECIIYQETGICLASIRSSRKEHGNICSECGRRGHLIEDREDGGMKHYSCCDIPPY